MAIIIFRRFYAYYNKFGASIGQFYTVLTIISALVPVSFAFYYKWTNSNAFSLALGASFFAFLFISCFYIYFYFKGANDLFYQATLSDTALKKELVTWAYWHWGRVSIEIISLSLLILSILKHQNNKSILK